MLIVKYIKNGLYIPFVHCIIFTPLHICTFKTPSLSAFMSNKGNCYHALEKCEGVKITWVKFNNIYILCSALFMTRISYTTTSTTSR